MSNNIDEQTVKDFFDYYKDNPLPNPEHYPKQFQFLVDSFLHYKRMKEIEND